MWRAPPCVAGCSSLADDYTRLVEFVEEGAIDTPHIEGALVVV